MTVINCCPAWNASEVDDDSTPERGHNPRFLLSSRFSIDSGIRPRAVYRNLSPAQLYEHCIKYEPGACITSSGALATASGQKTGRSPGDKRVVKDDNFEVWWANSSPNHPMDQRTYLANREAAVDFLNVLPRVYVVDGFACWDADCRMKVRAILCHAHHALFMLNMLIRPSKEELEQFGEPDFVIYNGGAFPANKYVDFMTSSTSIDLDLRRREMVILGTSYAGEMKKGIFTLLHYYLPLDQPLLLHSACNVGAAGDVTLFFGLSGTGKTALSSDPRRALIGDDEHCWGPTGVFNIEGGCYAKAINLSPSTEPEVFEATNRFGVLLENVMCDPESRDPDYSDSSRTENIRATYPIQFIHNARIPCLGSHPRNVILLCCDAFGVLPPVSRLSLEQALYHFVSGYTAKLAGTEDGIIEPQATFSACYAGAFIMWHPLRYAALLAEKMQQHGTQAWLVNTGWCGGSVGKGGGRIPLAITKAIINAIHSGELLEEQCITTPVFQLQVPDSCTGVPPQLLLPERAWPNPAAFLDTLHTLANLFVSNFTELTISAAAGVGVEESWGAEQNLLEQILSGGPQQVPTQQQRQQKAIMPLSPAVVVPTQPCCCSTACQQQQQQQPYHMQAALKQQQQMQAPKQQQQQHAQMQLLKTGMCHQSSGNISHDRSKSAIVQTEQQVPEGVRGTGGLLAGAMKQQDHEEESQQADVPDVHSSGATAAVLHSLSL